MDNYAVIFDMDGVIAHTNPYHTEAFKQFFDKYSVAYTLAEFEDHMYGKHNDYIMRYFFKRPMDDEEVKRLAEEKEALFREIYADHVARSEEHTSELQSLMRNSYAVFCL